MNKADQNSVAVLKTRASLHSDLPRLDSEDRGSQSVAERLRSLEDELRYTREDFVEMRNFFIEREKNGKTLINAYREVIADFADLFETHRNENIRRDETLRFFLSSIEGRIKTDIRNELSWKGSDEARRGWWPFRRGR